MHLVVTVNSLIIQQELIHNNSYTWIDGLAVIKTYLHLVVTVFNLDLTINYSTTGTDTQTACNSYTWIDGITYTSSNNTATTNAYGCDSVVTLDLTINYRELIHKLHVIVIHG